MPQDITNLLNFEVRLYGDLVPYTQTLSKCRCRIFYKYGNRNGTYITDEFANELIQSLPYAPVKGIYDEEDQDYTDHGRKRNLGRIYGIVPVDNNFAWENHIDDDGETRTYACTDVLVYTALYKEARDVVKKGQSMELYDKSIQGEWEVLDGIQYYVFKHGCFLGLQVLGDTTEPCFEGAGFYSLEGDMYKDLKEALELLRQFKEYTLDNEKHQEGEQMPSLKFANTCDIFSTLWSMLNTEFTEEKEWTVTYELIDVAENADQTGYKVLAKNLQNNAFEKVSFTKVEKTFEEDGEQKTTYELEVSETVPAVFKEIDTDFFTKINELLGTENIEEFTAIVEGISGLKEKISEFEQNFVEKDELISTLQTEKDNLQIEYNAQTEQLNALAAENEELKQYKLDNENDKKEAVLAKYAKKLDAETIDGFNSKLSDYTIVDLEKELAFALVNSDDSIFTEDKKEEGRIPKEQEKTGLDAILSKYKK